MLVNVAWVGKPWHIFCDLVICKNFIQLESDKNYFVNNFALEAFWNFTECSTFILSCAINKFRIFSQLPWLLEITVFWRDLAHLGWIGYKPWITNAKTSCPVMNDESLIGIMMTSSNGNIFRVTGPLCGEFTGPGEFPTQRPVTRSFDVFFDQHPNKRLSKRTWGWWFETLSRSLWRHCNVRSCHYTLDTMAFVIITNPGDTHIA